MKYFVVLFSVILISACTSLETKKEKSTTTLFINETIVKAVTDTIKTINPSADLSLLEKGVKHAASLWRMEDGTAALFSDFVKKNYIADPAKRKVIFAKISAYLESMSGNNNEITLDLRKTLDESLGEIDEIDRMFGNYSVGSHIQNDFYSNKIAFVIALNFPYFTLADKEKLGS